MRTFKRLLPYLLLNILLSAGTTLGVLWWWDRNHPSQPAPVIPAAAQTNPQGANALAQPPRLLPTPPPLDQPIIEIKSVFGAGDLQTEAVRLQRLGEGELWMTGWQLRDSEKNTYIFPELMLNKDGAVEVYTRDGEDTVIELYWGSTTPVWRSGEMVQVYDPQGNLRASYQIP